MMLRGIVQFLNRVLLTGLILYVGMAVVYVWQINHYPVLDANVKADGVVILTGGAERVDAGIAALGRGQATRALISGVHRDVKLDELMVLHHIPKDLRGQIDLGFGAIDTAGNAQETANWVRQYNEHSLIIVTSNYHMPRALLHLKAVLPLDVVLHPLVVTPPMLEHDTWYQDVKAWGLLGLAYNKYVLTGPEILLWRYRK